MSEWTFISGQVIFSWKFVMNTWILRTSGLYRLSFTEVFNLMNMLSTEWACIDLEVLEFLQLTYEKVWKYYETLSEDHLFFSMTPKEVSTFDGQINYFIRLLPIYNKIGLKNIRKIIFYGFDIRDALCSQLLKKSNWNKQILETGQNRVYWWPTGIASIDDRVIGHSILRNSINIESNYFKRKQLWVKVNWDWIESIGVLILV